jgi:ATP-binding cassette, subfamily B, bacterial
LQVVSILFIFVLAGIQISAGNLTSAEFVIYLTNIVLIISPIALTTSNYNELKQAEASVDRVFELLAIPQTITERPDAIVLPPATSKIEYHNVNFGYTSDRPILKDFNLTVKNRKKANIKIG